MKEDWKSYERDKTQVLGKIGNVQEKERNK